MKKVIDFIPETIKGKTCLFLAVWTQDDEGNILERENLGAFKEIEGGLLEGFCDYDRVLTWITKDAEFNMDSRVRYSNSTQNISVIDFDKEKFETHLDELLDEDSNTVQIFLPPYVSGWDAESLVSSVGELMEAMGYEYEPENEEQPQPMFTSRW